MEKEEAVYSNTPAVLVTGMQILSCDGVFRVAFVESIADGLPVAERCAVVMSLDTAKGLRKMLDQHITHQEK